MTKTTRRPPRQTKPARAGEAKAAGKGKGARKSGLQPDGSYILDCRPEPLPFYIDAHGELKARPGRKVKP